MHNKIILLGRLGSDVEAKESGAGTKYWRFSIATNEWIKSKGEEETTWHSVTCFNDYVGSMLEDKGKKGTLVYLEGKQTYNTYTNKEGQEVKTGGVVLDKFGSVCKVMIEKSTSGSSYVKPQVAKPGSGEFDDDIPF